MPFPVFGLGVAAIGRTCDTRTDRKANEYWQRGKEDDAAR
jgi:hypothetical protein